MQTVVKNPRSFVAAGDIDICVLYFLDQHTLINISVSFFLKKKSLTVYREKSSAAPVVQRSRVDNAGEFVVARLDDLINWARRVSLNGL